MQKKTDTGWTRWKAKSGSAQVASDYFLLPTSHFLLLTTFCLLLSVPSLAQQPPAAAQPAPSAPAAEEEEKPLPGDWAVALLDAIERSPNPEAQDALLRAVAATGPAVIPQLEEALKDDRTAEFAAQALAFMGERRRSRFSGSSNRIRATSTCGASITARWGNMTRRKPRKRYST